MVPMMTQQEFERRKAELMALQHDIDKQFRMMNAGLESTLAKIESARAKLAEDEQRTISNIVQFISDKYGMTIDIPDSFTSRH
jgi:hypothetical protein